MRIFITGGTGFLGRPLCAALREHELLVLTRTPAKVTAPARALQGDIFELASWKEQLNEFRPEACLHLAWSDLPDYSLANSAKNFQASVELFHFLGDVGCPRVVVTGTCFEYGKLTGCVTEDCLGTSLGLFAAFKSALRLVGESLFSGTQTKFVWARPFFVYGPGQRPTSLIPSVIHSIQNGMQPDIRTPNLLQDFIHVEDVARGLAALATSDAPSGVYNLGSGKPIRVADVVNMVARLLGRPEIYPHDPTLFHGGKDNGASGFWANIERMAKHTGWRPQLSLEEGIRETLAAWRPNA